ncbi:hypothetical protein [Geopsychrobacter electrodiphilus]|uniref:hypothetical protein n=1 Tax=Geopsychrobacter electrodiphilus TaxID=225196 RepID=UPI00037408C6|nr:hypothetical protein [Geopsychrobacter electrodiphilus]
MRILVLILCLVFSGCGGGGVYHVTKEQYHQQIKTLGVLPLLVDSRSVILHPDRQAIFELVRRAAAGQGESVVNALRKKKGYFDVRLIHDPPRLLAEQLLLKARVDELGYPAGYQLNLPYLAELCKKAVVDGLLIFTLQGAVHNDKRWSRKTLETLVTDYNDIVGTATLVAADGRVLWEMDGQNAEILLRLQYPDFDEAFYNRSDAVKLKFIGRAGLEKTLLTATGKDQEESTSVQIKAWLEKVTSALSPTFFH